MNCAQFIFGQSGYELPALRFLTDPICPPLSCSARTDQNHHAQTMYNHKTLIIPALRLTAVAPLRLNFRSGRSRSKHSKTPAVPPVPHNFLSLHPSVLSGRPVPSRSSRFNLDVQLFRVFRVFSGDISSANQKRHEIE